MKKSRRWLAAHPNWALTLVTLAVLAPFLAKPFNIDDPLFIWVAQQIQPHPGNPYGFDVNWAETVLPMWNVTENPPLACYYLALAAGVFGWSEIALHSRLSAAGPGRGFGNAPAGADISAGSPMLAALATLFTPVFLVSSTDRDVRRADAGVLGLGGRVLGRRNGTRRFRMSGRCRPAHRFGGVDKILRRVPHAAAGAPTVWFAMRRPGRWMIYLLIPLAALYAYQVATHGALRTQPAAAARCNSRRSTRKAKFRLFPNRRHADGADVHRRMRGGGGIFRAAALAAAGAGGIWPRRGFDCRRSSVQQAQIGESTAPRPAFVKFQIIFWAVGGIGVLALAIADIVQRRDAGAWLLALWVLGTFLFAAFFNWTVNGRSILPMAPAVGILIVRRLEKNFPAGDKVWSRGAVICLAASAALSLLVTRADFAARPRRPRKRAGNLRQIAFARPETLWFQGHWGFQFYMEEQGALAIDLANPALKPGDKFAVPVNNTHLRSPKLDTSAPREVITVSEVPIPDHHGRIRRRGILCLAGWAAAVCVWRGAAGTSRHFQFQRISFRTGNFAAEELSQNILRQWWNCITRQYELIRGRRPPIRQRIFAHRTARRAGADDHPHHHDVGIRLGKPPARGATGLPAKSGEDLRGAANLRQRFFRPVAGDHQRADFGGRR